MANHKKQPTHVTKISVDQKGNFNSNKIPLDKKEYKKYKNHIIKNNISRIFKKFTGVFVNPFKLLKKKIIQFVKFINSTPPIYSLPEFIKPHIDKNGDFRYNGTPHMAVDDGGYELYRALDETSKTDATDNIDLINAPNAFLKPIKKSPLKKDLSDEEEVKKVIKTISEIKKSKEYVVSKPKSKQTKNKPKSSKSHKKSTKNK
jgi:hypothetical protein